MNLYIVALHVCCWQYKKDLMYNWYFGDCVHVLLKRYFKKYLKFYDKNLSALSPNAW